MPENITHPQAPIETGSDAPPALSSPAATAAGGSEPTITSPPVLASPWASLPALPPEAYAMLELVGRGLAPDADQSTRSAARDLWARFGQLITATPMMPVAPMMPTAPGVPTAPGIPTPPTTPIATAARALRQLPPDQLLDLALQRLRAALPAGTTVPTPRGIQFQLVPIPWTPTGDR